MSEHAARSDGFPRFGAVILAAGASSRLGQPKQLLTHNGQALVARAASAALAGGASAVTVVLGASADEVAAALAHLPVSCVLNPRWAEGMGGSIGVGVAALLAREPALDAVLLAVCDQVHLSAAHVERLAAAFKGRACIAAAHYAGQPGVPALFGQDFFPALRAFKGETGAKALIRASGVMLSIVELPELATDIDTPDDWRGFHR